MQAQSSAAVASPRRSSQKSPRKRLNRAWSPPSTPTLFRSNEDSRQTHRAWERHPRPAAVPGSQGNQAKLIWKRHDLHEHNCTDPAHYGRIRARRDKDEKIVKKVRLSKAVNDLRDGRREAQPTLWDEAEASPHHKSSSAPVLVPRPGNGFSKAEAKEHAQWVADDQHEHSLKEAALGTAGVSEGDSLNTSNGSDDISASFCNTINTPETNKVPVIFEFETEPGDADRTVAIPDISALQRLLADSQEQLADFDCAGEHRIQDKNADSFESPKRLVEPLLDIDAVSPGSVQSELSQELDDGDVDDTCAVDPFSLQDTLVINDRILASCNNESEDSNEDFIGETWSSPLSTTSLDENIRDALSPPTEIRSVDRHEDADVALEQIPQLEEEHCDRASLDVPQDSPPPTPSALDEETMQASSNTSDILSLPSLPTERESSPGVEKNEITAQVEPSLDFTLKSPPNISDDDCGNHLTATKEFDAESVADANPKIATTSFKVQLNDDDADALRDFLNRSRASRASRAAKIAKRRSNDHRRDSETIKLALASPTSNARKVLEDLDANTTSSRKVQGGVDTVVAHMVGSEELGPAKGLDETGQTKGIEDANETGPSVRRSTRTASSKPAEDHGPSAITIRRPADPAQEAAEQNEKKKARDLYNLTKSNTRQNRGKSLSVRTMLKTLNTEATDGAPQEAVADRLRGVHWNEAELVQYFKLDGEGEKEDSSQEPAGPVATQPRARKRPVSHLEESVETTVTQSGAAAVEDRGEGAAYQYTPKPKSTRAGRLPTPSRPKANAASGIETMAALKERNSGTAVTGLRSSGRISKVPRKSETTK